MRLAHDLSIPAAALHGRAAASAVAAVQFPYSGANGGGSAVFAGAASPLNGTSRIEVEARLTLVDHQALGSALATQYLFENNLLFACSLNGNTDSLRFSTTPPGGGFDSTHSLASLGLAYGDAIVLRVEMASTGVLPGGCTSRVLVNGAVVNSSTAAVTSWPADFNYTNLFGGWEPYVGKLAYLRAHTNGGASPVIEMLPPAADWNASAYRDGLTVTDTTIA